MGDEIIIEKIEIIYSGLIQIDFKNKSKNETFRAFSTPDDFFGMIGNAMKSNYGKYLKKHFPDDIRDN